MTQLIAVMPHKQADRLGREWKPCRCNAYTRTMVRICTTDEEAMRLGRKLSCVWSVERAGA